MKQRIGVNFFANSIAYMLRIIMKDVSKKEHVLYAPDNHSNKEVYIDVIRDVMTFLTLRFKVQTVYGFKTSYFRVRSAHLSPGLPTGLTRVNPGWVLSLTLEKVGNTG